MAGIGAGQGMGRRLLEVLRVGPVGFVRCRRPGLRVSRLVVMGTEMRVVVEDVVAVMGVVVTLLDGGDHQVTGSGEAEEDRQSGPTPARGQAPPDMTNHDPAA
jgi:hypothetical protein